MEHLDTRAQGATLIHNVNIITESGIIADGSLVIEDGRITQVSQSRPKNGHTTVDGRGCWLLPGFIDIHGDSLENAIAPRPAAPFPMEYALPAFDAELTAHGITTMYYCIALADLGEKLTKPLRKREQAVRIVDAVNRFRSQARIRTHIHLRYEVLDVQSLPILRRLVENKEVDLISFMDHTPGYSVFKTIDDYRKYRERSGGSLEEADQEISERLQLRDQVDEEVIDALIEFCHQHALPTASHDDHTEEKIRQAAGRGIKIAEFPVSEEAAAAARPLGMQTVFGAANLVRDQSHAGNVLASDMINKELCDIICSDYSPMAMLQGLFKMKHRESAPLPKLLQLFTLNPAKAIGIDEQTGSIAEGKAADLILVRERSNLLRIATTFVNGEAVYASNDIHWS
jgi:alpha-D-ribose 1-methylphosphonate 5-triphosphate diphosphatase